MNGRAGTFSPISNDGSEWSGISRYQNGGDLSNYPPPTSNTRNNLATPPISGSSSSMAFGLGRKTGDPSPPNSIGRSSYGTQMSDSQRRKTLQMEESLSQHYAILKRYLAQSLRDEKGNAKPNRARDKLLRLSAVQFMELSTDVYDELLRRQSAAGQQVSGPGQVPPYLLPKENFHPKRNQARQKLATLPPPRFRDLATDVFYELERRFPKFAAVGIDRTGSPAVSMRGPPSRVGTPNGIRPGQGPPGSGPGRPGPDYTARNASLGGQVMAGLGIPSVEENGYGRPTAKTFQSNTIIPNKSTLVEDDDDQTGPEDNGDGRSFKSRRDTNNSYKADGGFRRDINGIGTTDPKMGELRSKINELESALRNKDIELDRLVEVQRQNDAGEGERHEWEGLRLELESKHSEALRLNQNLQAELDRVRQDKVDSEQQLRFEMNQITQGARGDDEWKMRYETLDKAHQQLEGDLRQQQKVTTEVKQEASTFLREMRALSERSSENTDREERLVRQVHRLEEEVNQWRNRYVQVKGQLRTLRAPSIDGAIRQPNINQSAKDLGHIEANGFIKHVHVTKLQVAIDELLRSARTSEPRSLFTHVRSIFVFARDIIQDAQRGTPSSDDQVQRITKYTKMISDTANNLVTAVRNFSSANGLSPVCLIDAAASHLTNSVVALASVVKIKPATPEENEDEDDDNSFIAESPATYYGMKQYRRPSVGDESIYSTMSPVQQHALPTPSLQTPKSQYMNQAPHYQNGLSNGGPYNSTSARPGLGITSRHGEAEELKAFLEDQTDGLVQAITSLVESIRADDSPATVQSNTEAIVSILSKIISESQMAITESPDDEALRENADPIVDSLAALRDRLSNAGEELDNIRDAARWKEFTKTIPPLAFQVARETRTLVGKLEALGVDGGEDDFR